MFFLPRIWISTEGEGDWIKSIFSTSIPPKRNNLISSLFESQQHRKSKEITLVIGFWFFVYLHSKSDLKIKDVTFWHFGISKTPFTWGNEPLHTCKSCQYFANLVWKKCIPSKWKVLPTSSTCYAWLHTGCIMFLSSLTFH